MLPVVLGFGVAGILSSCGGGGSNSGSEGQDTVKVASGPTIADSMTNPGIGPVKHVELGNLDGVMAKKGQGIFESKCATCHKFESKYVGPQLGGVTKRRMPEWIMNQMLNPAEMIKEDPMSKALFAKYLVPMTFQNITQDDARAILEYFRQNDAK